MEWYDYEPGAAEQFGLVGVVELFDESVVLLFLALREWGAAFPFLLFEVPIVGTALHGAEKTGYDRSGTLAPRLSPALLKMKIEAEKKHEEFLLAEAAKDEGAVDEEHHDNEP